MRFHACVFLQLLPKCDTDAGVCFVLQLFFEAEDGRHDDASTHLSTAFTTTVEVTLSVLTLRPLTGSRFRSRKCPADLTRIETKNANGLPISQPAMHNWGMSGHSV